MYAALILLGIAVVMFILQLSIPGFTEAFLVLKGISFVEPWRFVTGIFLHSKTNYAHLLYNMFALGLFGTILESVIGKKKFLWIFFSGGILSSVGSAMYYPAALGASGAIMAILGALAVLRPRMQVWVSWIPMPMFVAAFVWAAGDLVGLFVPSGVANLAHLIGLAFGIGVGFYFRKELGDWTGGKRESYGTVPLNEEQMKDWEDRWMK